MNSSVVEIVCIGVVLRFNALFRKSSLQYRSGEGGQLCFIFDLESHNNHLLSIFISLELLPR
ncbi:uncharacterized protein G2W53_000315 [Senna tora]|uniref:Uncharacterized protein n=1 Tax=Senna tora TaxID=362788 RepID=A0A834XFA8_9FABA|nr:uncharacterized protein G2W53_000315 [Senna tora]